MKYIHVDGEDGLIYVMDELDDEFYGWAYEVADDFTLTTSLEQLAGASTIGELLEDNPNARLVKKH